MFIAFATQGCLRSYTIGRKGEERVDQFTLQDEWVSDLPSFLTGEPASRNIDAVEDSEVLLLHRTSREELLTAVPKLERFFRLLQEHQYVAAKARFTDFMVASAEERYRSFLKMYPTLGLRLPQSQIAAYVGITPQSLNRIRRELSHAK